MSANDETKGLQLSRDSWLVRFAYAVPQLDHDDSCWDFLNVILPHRWGAKDIPDQVSLCELVASVPVKLPMWLTLSLFATCFMVVFGSIFLIHKLAMLLFRVTRVSNLSASLMQMRSPGGALSNERKVIAAALNMKRKVCPIIRIVDSQAN